MTLPIDHKILDDIHLFLSESVGDIPMDSDIKVWTCESKRIKFKDGDGWYEIVVRKIEEPSA